MKKSTNIIIAVIAVLVIIAIIIDKMKLLRYNSNSNFKSK